MYVEIEHSIDDFDIQKTVFQGAYAIILKANPSDQIDRETNLNTRVKRVRKLVDDGCEMYSNTYKIKLPAPLVLAFNPYGRVSGTEALKSLKHGADGN